MSLNIKTSQGLKRINTVHITKLENKVLEKDVNFYDYDGTLIKSYSKNDFLKLSSLPDNPSHEGLTAQGWNWSLSDAKSYVNDYGKLNIGQMYTTSDGKTRIYIHLEEGRLNPELNLTFVESGSFTVDWRDGTAIDTVSGEADYCYTATHTYANSGDYIIEITVLSGTLSIEGSYDYSRLLCKPNPMNVAMNNGEVHVYGNSIRKIEIGNGITSLSDNALKYCYSLKTITIPNTVTDIKDNSFYYCYSLVSITIPNSINSIGGQAFVDCFSLASVILPNNVSILNSFKSCLSLKSITLPNGVTNISYSTFDDCRSLSSVILPNNLTSIGSKAFIGCYSLTSITIPDSVTTIGDYAFSGCDALSSVTILSNITTIAASTFRDCCSLASITIPNSITSIDNYAFADCHGLGYIKFESETPPIIASGSFMYLPKDCIIYVPQGTLSAYTSAQYYPDPAIYTYVEY